MARADVTASEDAARAMRDEAAAAHDAAGAVEELGRGGAALEASTRAAEDLAAAMREVAAASTAARAAQEAAASARAPAFSGATDTDFKASKWEKAPGVDGREKAASKPSAAAGGAKGADLAKVAGGAKDAAKWVGGATVALGAYGAALSGVKSLGALTDMAIGWRALGQLQMVSWKATMDLRRSVAGVDAQPLVRAATALEKNLSKSTVTGSALSGMLTRGFDATFQAIEKLEPVAEAVLQGMVIGGLRVEIAWHRMRATLAPVTVALEEALEDVDGLQLAADGTAAAFKLTAAAVETVASGIRAAYDAATLLEAKLQRGAMPENEQIRLGNQERESAAQRERDKADTARGPREVYTSVDGAKPILTAAQTAEAATGGEGVGKAVAEGIVKGMDDGASAVKAAGKRSGEAAVTGAREGADAHSPSRKTQQLGRDLGEGEVEGLEETAPAVARAASKALAPDVAAAGPGRSATGTAPASVSLTLVFPGIVSGEVAKVAEQGARAGLQEGLRQLTIAMGLPIPGASPP